MKSTPQQLGSFRLSLTRLHDRKLTLGHSPVKQTTNSNHTSPLARTWAMALPCGKKEVK